MSLPRRHFEIHIYPWPESAEVSGQWQGDLIIDGEVVAGFTCPGGLIDHASYGVDLLAEHIVDDGDESPE